MAFIFLIAITVRYFGWITLSIPTEVELRMLDIMQGYIWIYAGGRSGEKIAKAVIPLLNKNK